MENSNLINSSIYNSTYNGLQGGFMNILSESLVIKNCLLSDGDASDGGAIYWNG
jgi:hypothetical protein